MSEILLISAAIIGVPSGIYVIYKDWDDIKKILGKPKEKDALFYFAANRYLDRYLESKNGKKDQKSKKKAA